MHLQALPPLALWENRYPLLWQVQMSVTAIWAGRRPACLSIFKAYDGKQAIDLLKKEEIHLLIMDIMMPKLDGIRATLNIVLDRSHLHGLPVHHHLLGVVVDDQTSHLVDGLALRVQAPQGGVEKRSDEIWRIYLCVTTTGKSWTR